jgi:SAM-dependent methyltransferase
MPAHLDQPVSTSPVDPLCFLVRGWVWLGPEHARITGVEVWAGDTLVGETRALYARPDVNAALGLPPVLVGFDLFAHHPGAQPGVAFELALHARLDDGTRTPALTLARVTPIARDYRQNHFGVLLDRHTTAIQREENIFATGPSQREPNGELALLLRRYLGPPPRRIVDVGCGFGSYGRGLLADGYDWLGAEIDAADCAELARQGLPHRQVAEGQPLPFADGEFDAALCLEVLEHIEEPQAFLREIHRVSPRQLIVSVPNCELLGYFWDHLAVPWHMLESTHVNYFTRWSLEALLKQFYAHVELRFYAPHPLRTLEGTPLYYNLLAVARAPR